jgi:hypothetical protein
MLEEKPMKPPSGRENGTCLNNCPRSGSTAFLPLENSSPTPTVHCLSSVLYGNRIFFLDAAQPIWHGTVKDASRILNRSTEKNA